MRKQTLTQVAEDSPCGGKGWCFLREYFLYLGSDRSAMQLRSMIDYRWVMGKRLGREVTNEEAFNSWVSDGYAKRFSDIYDARPNTTHVELKRELFGE